MKSYYWIKSNITEDPEKWEIGYKDHRGDWWIFGISGWLPESKLIEVGPKISPPDQQ